MPRVPIAGRRPRKTGLVGVPYYAAPGDVYWRNRGNLTCVICLKTFTEDQGYPFMRVCSKTCMNAYDYKLHIAIHHSGGFA